MAMPYAAIADSALKVGSSATGSFGQIASAYAAEDQVGRNWERLQELQKLEDLNALGLTEEEMQAQYDRMNNQAQSVARAGRDARDRALSAYMGSGAGALLPYAAQAQQQEGRLASAMGASIADASRIREEQQLQEIEDRLAYDVAQKQAKIAAFTNLFTAGLAQAGDIVNQQAKMGSFDQNPADQMDPADMEVLMQDDEMYGFMQGLGE